jgi:hypothetical protein
MNATATAAFICQLARAASAAFSVEVRRANSTVSSMSRFSAAFSAWNAFSAGLPAR